MPADGSLSVSEGCALCRGQRSAAQARRRSRTPAGRTERRSRREHRPALRAGKVRAAAPCDARRTGYGTTDTIPPEARRCGVYGGCKGV